MYALLIIETLGSKALWDLSFSVAEVQYKIEALMHSIEQWSRENQSWSLSFLGSKSKINLFIKETVFPYIQNQINRIISRHFSVEQTMHRGLCLN